MNLSDFYSVLARSSARGFDLSSEQKQAVAHSTGPLWILAGPGSGKTEVLVTRALKLLTIEDANGQRVQPRSVFITTFTKKAARNLEDRLATYLMALQTADRALQSVDLSELRVGTLHSLCDDILREFRYPDYQNVRLLDDVDQHLFVYRNAAICNEQNAAFWATFESAVPNWRASSGYAPSKWRRAKAAVILFNRLVEDLIDINQMVANGGSWAQLAQYYLQYEQTLRERYRCDFAHLQARFRAFLNSPASQRFLLGDGQNNLPLTQVLVDEYQDTNPIQERIYLALAQAEPHNLTVVGDDDQALYRFRGGTVTCMVNFDRACQAAYMQMPLQTQLRENYRSHPAIVSFFNNHIQSFPLMNTPGVRAAGKQPMLARSSVEGSYPAVSWITRPQVASLAGAVANLIQNHLIADGIISDLSQCVLLFRSTKDSPRNAGPFIDEFRRRNIPIYNPRSKSFMESEEVQCLLAALVRVIDLNLNYTNNIIPNLATAVQDWINTLVTVVGPGPHPLTDYVNQSAVALPAICATTPGAFLNLNLLEIMYRILSREPFRTWRQEPMRNLRLSKVTRLFESYHSLNLDLLRSNTAGTALDDGFVNRFYNMLIAYFIETGIDDDEDEEVVVPSGTLPLMTIHQSKGLEFPFVIVAQIVGDGRIGAAQILEGALAPFRQNLYPRPMRPAAQLAAEDDIRLFYVAHSRAEYAVIMVGTFNQLKDSRAIPSGDQVAFRRNTQVLTV